MTERDDIETTPDATTGDPGLDERAALAERVEADPATDAELDRRSRRVLGQMRELRAVLREAGPARVSEGFGDRVLARLRQGEAPAPVARLAPRPRARRPSPALLIQAASLVALLFAYGALLAATRVHDVAPRWTESSESSETAEPAAAARFDVVPPPVLAACRFARGGSPGRASGGEAHEAAGAAVPCRGASGAARRAVAVRRPLRPAGRGTA